MRIVQDGRNNKINHNNYSHKQISMLTEQEDIESRLTQLRAQIYRPYKSVLSTENQQQSQPMQSIVKNHSLQLKSKRQKLLVHKKRSVRLPSIHKKSSMNQDLNLQSSITDFVSDPYLNGRIKNQREILYGKLSNGSKQFRFLQTVEKFQLEFVQHCFYKRYVEAEDVLSRLLNYTIDLDLIDQLGFSLKILGDFHFQCLHSDQAFFYYNQGRKCGLLIGRHCLMAECLIQMAICASRSNLFAQSIRFLKKALEYIWFFDLVSLQLKVYDQIGKAYYMMGDVQKAKNFHHKFFTGSIEPKNSSIRLLSKQSLVLQGLQQMVPIRNVTSVFLWMIHLPIKNCEQLQQFSKSSLGQYQGSPRKTYSKDMRYYSQFLTLRQAITRVFQESFFKNQLGQMHFEKSNWTDPLRIKKYLSLDIQRNNHLKSLGIPFQNYFAKAKQVKLKQFKGKQKRFKTEANSEQPQESNPQRKVEKWFNMITSETIKKYRYKNSQISQRVNLRGMDKHHESNASSFRTLYNQYFQLVSQK